MICRPASSNARGRQTKPLATPIRGKAPRPVRGINGFAAVPRMDAYSQAAAGTLSGNAPWGTRRRMSGHAELEPARLRRNLRTRGISVSASWIRARRAVCGLALLAAALAGDTVLAANIQLSAKVPTAKWKAVRIRNLPKDATVAVTVRTSGVIGVIFARHEELRRFPASASAIFRGTADNRLSFRVIVPESGNYYVILDNRAGTGDRTVRLLIQVNRGSATPPSPQKKKPEGETRT